MRPAPRDFPLTAAGPDSVLTGGSGLSPRCRFPRPPPTRHVAPSPVPDQEPGPQPYPSPDGHVPDMLEGPDAMRRALRESGSGGI